MSMDTGFSVRDFAHCVMSYPPEDIVEEIKNLHRTEQQCMMNVIMECIKSWSKDADEGWYDLRNEATVKLANKIMKAIGEEPHLPFI
jgi:hypothetical protein